MVWLSWQTHLCTDSSCGLAESVIVLLFFWDKRVCSNCSGNAYAGYLKSDSEAAVFA